MKKPCLTALFFLLAIPFMMFPAAAQDGETEQHSLQIQYLDENGSQVFPTYSAQMIEGEEYSVPSPDLEEAEPSPDVVEGVMGDEDVSEIVTYASYKGTINWLFEDGTVAAPASTFSLAGLPAQVKFSPPSVSGYSTYNFEQTHVQFDSSHLVHNFYFVSNNQIRIYPCDSYGNVIGSVVKASASAGESFSVTLPVISGYYLNSYVYTGTKSSSAYFKKVKYTKGEKKNKLTIDYVYEDGSQAAASSIQSLAQNSSYNVTSPSIRGFTPDQTSVTGTITADTHITVTYKRTSWPLTIRWLKQDGSNMFRGDSVYYIEPGKGYSYTASTVKGYIPDIPVVSGTMPNEALTVTVIYSPKVSNLLIDYVFKDGTEASPSASFFYEYNQSYEVSSPAISGYTPDLPLVTGTMGEEDIHIIVTYKKDTCLLTINYQFEDGRSASKSYTGDYKPGDSYNIRSPDVKGYQPDKPTVSGVMPSDDLTVTVTYSQPPRLLTIHYHYEDGSEAAPSYTASVKYGNFFSVPSPAVPGFTPERSVVSGKMGEANATFTVVYKPTKYLLTIKYNRQSGKARTSGTKIAPDYTGRYMEGEKYEIPSPSVMGYETQVMTVSGVMPAHDVIETVSYRLAGEPVMGDTTGLLDVVSSSGEYMRQYISDVLLTLITAGLVMFSGFMVIRFILYIINRLTRV